MLFTEYGSHRENLSHISRRSAHATRESSDICLVALARRRSRTSCCALQPAAPRPYISAQRCHPPALRLRARHDKHGCGATPSPTSLVCGLTHAIACRAHRCAQPAQVYRQAATAALEEVRKGGEGGESEDQKGPREGQQRRWGPPAHTHDAFADADSARRLICSHPPPPRQARASTPKMRFEIRTMLKTTCGFRRG